MDDLLKALLLLRDKCGRTGADLRRDYGLKLNEVPLAAFDMCFNTVTSTAEVCSYYAGVWKAATSTAAASAEEAKRQNGERIVLQTKMMFVLMLSAMEYCSRVVTKQHPAVVPLNASLKWQYLSTIIGKSHASGIVNIAAKAKWDGMFILRNTVVHNNGIADEDLDIVLDGATLQMRAGQMTVGNILSFVKCGDWIVQAYADWCKEFLKRAGYPKP